ncbi:hypothetical protein M422DRAFT_253034 [Sphaerobolus stellatus SS14]|uniref:Uncharacterized protein n=1 Tax=Sphaerobolus stellatus (strain SS14) TaxID=990650 RepID=A0A0C9V9X8_SPHS4|nr:hypothetical protein M422DRAFT_253034 [Sphaerobolus stellatus SS14]
MPSTGATLVIRLQGMAVEPGAVTQAGCGKVNTLLHKEAPEEVLLEAAREVRTIHFQLDQNTGIQQMVRQAIQNASHEEEPEKSFLAKASVKMGNPPTYSSECNLEKFENWVASKVQLQFLGQCLTDEAQEWFYQQKWFMLTLSLNKVAVNYDRIMQGSMTVQQLYQELTKLAKQMMELLDVYSYRRQFMNVLKPDIREQVLKKGFTAEYSKIDELMEEAVTLDNAKHYTSGYNSSHSTSSQVTGDTSFRNRVLIPDERPDYWSLHMWNTLNDWHTNPMSAPNAIRDDSKGYFLEEYVDVAAWISKVSMDISRLAFMNQMKAVFGSSLNFETAFSGSTSDLLRPNHEATMWLTDSSTPLQSRLSIHALTPAKTGESSQQHLDADLDSYHQAWEPVLSYDEVLPSGTPDVEMEVPATAGTSGTLPSESTMNVVQELDDLYQ